MSKGETNSKLDTEAFGKKELSPEEKGRLLEELSRQFGDLQRSAQQDVIEALGTIGRMTNDGADSVSFREAISGLPLEKMAKGEVPNSPRIPEGVDKWIELLLTRDNEMVGNNLSLGDVVRRLKEEINKPEGSKK